MDIQTILDKSKNEELSQEELRQMGEIIKNEMDVYKEKDPESYLKYQKKILESLKKINDTIVTEV